MNPRSPSPQDGRWRLAFGDMAIRHIAHRMPLPELPQGSAVV